MFFVVLGVFFRNLHVFCCPCLLILFLPVPIFLSTVWISTRRNTLVASVLVTGKLFFVKSVFNVFKTNASDMHKKNDIQYESNRFGTPKHREIPITQAGQ